ncbi:TorF family putative porin [Scleromatobacter humisilvae]|uniref:TorF family putative porin n=1 Tax=Scleromatobacter humisilvae TaxID=2897159 RepID=A0A9X1YG45_9BURK|nr:TorF family putative porin [Scleromatobacter humisilvae]MCK9685884.1 TorF family putative porin [Scleromatobacter humisilvae]
MKKTALAAVAVLALAAGPTIAFADDAPAPAAAASAPDASPITYNIGVVSDYRYRGISQSKMKPALQGGIDYANGPIYVGTWASTIQWVKDAMVGYNRAGEAAAAANETTFTPVSEKGAPVEWDLYGGTKGDIIKDTLSYDVGVLAYVYLGQKFHDIHLSNPDTGEVYGALTYGVFTAKVSVSATPLFGIPKSKGSQYYDLSANFDLGSGFSLTPDVAYQHVEGSYAKDNGLPSYSYGAYSATLGKDFGKGVSASLQVIATDAKKADYVTSNGRFTGRTTVVAGVKYSF